jgi:hypothetical protein
MWWRGKRHDRRQIPESSAEPAPGSPSSIAEFLGAELVAQCEAFLEGRLAEQVEGQVVRVPVWVWTNLLAHGAEQDLCSERCVAQSCGLALNDDWRNARS